MGRWNFTKELCFICLSGKRIGGLIPDDAGHLINRIRFHMDRHHTEYVRKVRAASKPKKTKKQASEGVRHSSRATQASSETKLLHSIIAEKDREIEELCRMLDWGRPTEESLKETADKEMQTLSEGDVFADQCLCD